jgi:hypothetical protein
MIRRDLYIGRWAVHFFFCPDGYDENEILDLMYALDADDYNLVKASKKMRKGRLNEGFTFTNPEIKEAIVVIGPTTSGKQFQNSISHEIDHLSDDIARWYGIKKYKEGTSYLTGDTTMALADIICRLGCGHCRKE